MKLNQIFRRRKEDSDLAQELESHLEHEVDDNLARGMSTEEARRNAHIKLGNPLVIRDRVWDANWLSPVEDLWRDLRFAARTLMRDPSFTYVALMVMALGIGANTAIYSFLDSLLLRELPVSDPASLVVINWHTKTWQGDSVVQNISGSISDDAKLGKVSGNFPYSALEVFQNSAIFSDVFAYADTSDVDRLNVSIKGQAEIAGGEIVSGGYFNGLRIVPAAGRLILPDDDRVGAAPVAVVSYAFSEKNFGGAAAAAGQNVLLNNHPFTIVGVAPPEFFGVDPSSAPEIYVPMHANLLLDANDPYGFRASDYLDNRYYWMEAMARLRPGVTLAQAQAELAPKFHQWVAATAKNDEERSKLPEIVLREGAGGLDTLRRQYSKPLYLLMILVVLILAIACSNVANLLLARATSRRREIALRLSEGASRTRIIRQLLTESVLLALLGGALGVLLAVWGIQLLTSLLAQGPDGAVLHAELNWHVLGLSAALALVTGILFGLAPALQSTRVDLVSALKETQAGQSSARHHRAAWRVNMRQILVVGQMAASLLMLVAAGLFVRTLSNLESVSLGFNRENLLLFQLNARQAGNNDAAICEFYRAVREQLAAIPGVQSAGLARGSLIDGESTVPISTVGTRPQPDTRYMPVGPDFLTTMQIPILEGRDFNEHDRPRSQPVAVVSEEFARINFPGRNPVGQYLQLWKDEEQRNLARDMEIVGVAKNARYGSLQREMVPVVYVAYDQGYPQPNEMMFVLRTLGDPLSYVSQVREIVHQADARVPVSEIRTQKAEIAGKMYQETLLAELCSAFALLALTIASVGLYGTISYGVVRRTGEIGIRMAMGAPRGPVVWMVLREVWILVAAGLAISFPLILATSKFLQSLLFDMKSNDPLTLGLALAILVSVSLGAGCLPARRASRIDPATALRHE